MKRETTALKLKWTTAENLSIENVPYFCVSKQKKQTGAQDKQQ